MRTNDAIQLTANVTIEVCDAASGRLLRREQRHNLVTLAGRNLVRDLFNGLSPAGAITHFAVGTGTATPTANDTALVAEVFRDAVTKRTPDVGKLTLQYYLPSTAANGYALAEAGLFTAATGGTLVARVVFQAINKNASLSVTYTWDLTISAS